MRLNISCDLTMGICFYVISGEHLYFFVIQGILGPLIMVKAINLQHGKTLVCLLVLTFEPLNLFV